MHISAVSASFLGFVARGVGVMRGDAWLRRRITRVLPHVIDTILLASALGMLWVAHLSPWALDWLRAKRRSPSIAGLALAWLPVPSRRKCESTKLRGITVTVTRAVKRSCSHSRAAVRPRWS